MPGSSPATAVLSQPSGSLPTINPARTVAGMSRATQVFASARVIAVLTMTSRVMGLVREGVLSYFFSTSELLSAFRLAFMVPNLARRLFGEGALSAAMIPVLTESLRTNDDVRSRRFVGRLLVVLAVILAAGTVLIEMLVGTWRMVHEDPALRLVAIMMPYMVPICVTAVIGGVLNVRRSFAIPAGAPILLNVAIIVAAAVGGGLLGRTNDELMTLIALGVVAGGLLQLAVSWLGLHLVRFVPLWRGDPAGQTGAVVVRLPWQDPLVRKVCTLLLPMTVGLSAMQLNSLVDYLIAYLFVVSDGERVGPAVLGYAQYLYQLPLGVFGISLATAVFPVLADRAAERDMGGFSEILARGIRMTLVTALPAAVGLIMISRPLVAVLFERGRFGSEDTLRVAGVLNLYSLGLAFYFTQHLLVRAFYSLHDSRTPAKVAGTMVAVDLLLNLCLVFVMQERGLALSTSLCSALQVLWLGRVLGRRVNEIRWSPMIRGSMRTIAATTAMAIAVWGASQPGVTRAVAHGRASVELVWLLAVGLLVYIIALLALRPPELFWLLERRERTPSADL